jgi:hypothetical protein
MLSSNPDDASIYVRLEVHRQSQKDGFMQSW